MGTYISPFGGGSNAPAASGGKPKSTNYISPFAGSQYTEDYWKKKDEENKQVQQQKQVEQRKQTVKDNIAKSDADLQKTKDAVFNPLNIFKDVAMAPGNFIKGAGKAVSEGTKDAIDKTVNVYNQIRLSKNIQQNSSAVGQGAVDKLKKFVDQDEKSGLLTKQQADAKRSHLQSEADKTAKAVAGAEKKVGVKFDQNKAATDLLETAANLTGAGQLTQVAGKGVAKKVVESGVAQDVANIAGKTFNALRIDALKGFAKDQKPTSSLLPDVQSGQFKGTFLDPQKVNVVKGYDEGTKLGVKSPVKVGVKDVSNTSSVEVRAPQAMTNEEYKKQLLKISKSYDKAQKDLEGMPPLKQQSVAQSVEDTHVKALEDLNDAFSNPRLPEGTSRVKSIEKSTTKAPENVGGVPKGFANTTGEMTDLETTLFNAAKNKAEKRLGRELNTQENNNLFERTKQTVSDKIIPAKEPSARETAAPTPAEPPISVSSTPQQISESANIDPVLKQPEPVTAINSNAEQIGTSVKETPPKVEGDTVSGNSARIEQHALEKKLTDKMGDLPQYKSINMKEQAKEAVDLVSNDRQKAIDIIDGKVNAPGNLKAQSVHQALEDIAVREGDGALLTKLAKSHVNTELSESAQNLRIAAERDPHSPVEQIRQIRDARVKAAERRSKTTVSKETTDIKRKVDAATPKAAKQDWNSFVKELTC